MEIRFTIRHLLLLMLLTGTMIAGVRWYKATVLNAKLRIPISELDLSSRAQNCLEYAGVETVRELVRLSEEELFAIRNFGETSMIEIREKLNEFDLHLNMNVAPTRSVH